MNPPLFIISLSITLQLLSVFVALRLMTFRGQRAIGTLMFLVAALMSFRRLIPLERLIAEGEIKTDLFAESVGCIISFILLAGFLYLSRLIASHQREINERKRSEEAARETNAKLRSLIQAMPDAVYFKDCDGRLVMANKALEELFGANEETLINKTDEDLMPPDLAKSCRKSDEELLKGRRTLHSEEAMTGKNGEKRYFDTVKAPIYGSRGDLLGLVGVSRDVTERRLKDDAIRESEERFRGAFENAAVGASIVDLRGRFIKVNKRICHMLGYSEEELLSKTFSDVTHPEDIQIGVDALKDLIAGKVDALSFEKRYLRRDGHVVYMNVSPSMIRDQDGRPAYCLGLFQDITETKRAEDMIARLHRKNELILNSAGEGIYGLDIDGNTTFVNPAAAKMIGWDANELIGRQQHNILHHSRPDGTPYPKEDCKIYAAFKDGQVHHVTDEVFWRKDGTSFPVEYVSTPLHEGGRIVGAVVVFNDISERKQIEDALKSAMVRAKEEKARTEAFIAAIGDAISIQDTDFRIIFQNQANVDLFGRHVGERCYTAYHERDSVCDNCHLVEMFRDGRIHKAERGSVRGGKLRYFEFTASPVKDSAGTITGGIELIREITERKEVEEALRSSEERLFKAQKMAHIGHWEKDLISGHLYWSDEIYRIYGVDPAQFTPTTDAFMQAMHPEDREPFVKALNAAVHERKFLDMDYRLIRPDGTMRTVHTISEVSSDPAGRPLIHSGTVQDITEQKKAQESLVLFKNLLNQSQDAIFVNDPVTGRFLMVNNRACSNLGYSVDRLLTMSTMDIEAVFQDQALWDAHVDEVRNKGNVIMQGVHKRHDGTAFPVEVNVTYMTVGEKDYMVAVARDVTERKLSEQALRLSEERLSRAQKMAHVGNWSWNIVTNEISWSEEVYHIYGVEPAQFTPTFEAVAKATYPDDLEPYITALNAALHERKPFEMDYRLIRPDGTIRTVHSIGEMTYGPDGQPLVHSGTVQDVTELRQAAEALRRSEAMLQAIIDTEPECVKLVDSEARLIMMNRAGLGMLEVDSFEQVKDQYVGQMVVPEYREPFMELTRSIFQGKSGNLLFEIVGAKGTRRWLDTHAVPFRNEKDEIVALLAVTRDVTERKWTEEALYKTNETLNALIRYSPLAIICTDLDSNVMIWNPAAERIFGWKEEEVLGRKNPIIPEGKEEEYRALRERVRQGEPYLSKELVRKRKDGTLIHLSAASARIHDAEGNIDALFALFQDITERKKAEETLRKTHAQLQTLIQTIPDMIVFKDVAGRHVIVNRAVEEVTGHTKDEITGKTIEELLPPDPAAACRKSDEDAMQRSEPSHAQERVVRGDGRETYFDMLKAPMIDSEGNIIGLVAIGRDITERQHMEEALRKSEANYRALLEQASDGIAVIDRQGRYLDVNSRMCGMLGYSREEFLRLTIKDVLAPQELSVAAPLRLQELLTGKTVLNERLMRRKDGSTFPMEISATMIPDGRLCGIHRDISERKRVEVALRKSHEELEVLVSERTAELRMINEQLSMFSSYLQEAREKERTSIAREIHDELGQALTALKMDLSWLKKRLPKNQKTLLEKEGSMSELVETTIQTVKRISTELRPGILDHLGLTAAIEWQAEEFQKRIGIPCAVSIVPEEIVPDKDRSTTIFRIFQETLTNITRHAKATKVTVKLEKKNNSLILEVKDDGKGITEMQLSDSKSLGLMGIRERAASWGGHVSMKGVRNGGTTVIVHIPLDRTGGTA